MTRPVAVHHISDGIVRDGYPGLDPDAAPWRAVAPEPMVMSPVVGCPTGRGARPRSIEIAGDGS